MPVDLTSPCVFFPAGGAADTALAVQTALPSLPTATWNAATPTTGESRYAQCVYGEDIRSPWSDTRSFTVKAGLPVSSSVPRRAATVTEQRLSRLPGEPGILLLVTAQGDHEVPLRPVQERGFDQPVAEADVTTTAFEYDGTLEYSTNYFWQVKALEPAPSDPSATFSFMTEAAPAAEAGAAKAAPTPVWVWVIIAIGAILVIVTLVLIFKTRRV